MQRKEDLSVLSEELLKLDQIFDDLVDSLDKYSTRTVSRKLRKLGEEFIILSKAIRRKNFPKYMREKNKNEMHLKNQDYSFFRWSVNTHKDEK
jgi:hypothetical protein